MAKKWVFDDHGIPHPEVSAQYRAGLIRELTKTQDLPAGQPCRYKCDNLTMYPLIDVRKYITAFWCVVCLRYFLKSKCPCCERKLRRIRARDLPGSVAGFVE